MTLTTSNSEEAARIRERLAQLGAEQEALKARLAEIETQRPIAENGPRPAASVTGLSPAHDKIAIFRSLFGGREDVYPKRWENAKTGKAGYAPVCANEWAPRLCGKPRVKCGACPNQAFREVTDEAIDGHLRGRRTIGVYGHLVVDECHHLSAVSFEAVARRAKAKYVLGLRPCSPAACSRASAVQSWKLSASRNSRSSASIGFVRRTGPTQRPTSASRRRFRVHFLARVS